MRLTMEALESERERWLAEVPQPLQELSSTVHGPFVNWLVVATQFEDVKFKESFKRISHWWETWALATTTKYLWTFHQMTNTFFHVLDMVDQRPILNEFCLRKIKETC